MFVAKTTTGAILKGKLSFDLSSITRVGLDLAKNVFQVHAVDAQGREIDKRAIRRGKLVDYFATCRHAPSGWKRAVQRITGRASSRRWGMR